MALDHIVRDDLRVSMSGDQAWALTYFAQQFRMDAEELRRLADSIESETGRIWDEFRADG